MFAVTACGNSTDETKRQTGAFILTGRYEDSGKERMRREEKGIEIERREGGKGKE